MRYAVTEKTHGVDGLPTVSEMDRRFQHWTDNEATTRTSCGRCDWSHEGSGAEGRALFRDHLATAHPGVKPKARRRRRNNDDDRAEAMAAAAARRDLAGAVNGDGSS